MFRGQSGGDCASSHSFLLLRRRQSLARAVIHQDHVARSAKRGSLAAILVFQRAIRVTQVEDVRVVLARNEANIDAIWLLGPLIGN